MTGEYRRAIDELTKPTLLVIAHPDDKDMLPPLGARVLLKFHECVPRGKVITLSLREAEEALEKAVWGANGGAR